MKRNKNRDRLVCGFLSLILAAGMTQGCASPHVSDQSNHNSQETGEDQTPSYSYEDTDKADSGPAPAETNASSGAGKKKTPDDEKIPDNEKTPDDASKDKTGQKKNSSDASSQEEKAKKDNQEKASSKKEAATVKAESPDTDKKEESKPDRTDPDPDYEDPETPDPDSEDRQDPDETEIEEEDTEERDYYDEDRPVEYEYPEEENTGEDLTDDLPGFSDEDVVPEEISAAEDTSDPEETAQTDTAMGEIQDMPEGTPEEPVYDILSYISSIDSLENLVGQLEMYPSEPRMLADYQDVKAYDRDSLHIEFSYEGSRMYISNDGETLPNIVNVTAGSSLLGEDYNSLSVILEAQGWVPVASEIDPADSVISASYNQNLNGMNLVFTIYFKEDNKINRWTIDNLQQ